MPTSNTVNSLNGAQIDATLAPAIQDAPARPAGGAPVKLLAGPRVFEVLLGSWSQGLAREGSDADWRGVFIGGPTQWAEPLSALQEERTDPLANGVDAVFWSQWRFAQLLGQGNFMALKPLFCAESLIERDDGPLAQLRERREAFLSQQTIDGLGGVALAQLRALEKLAGRPQDEARDRQLARVAAHALRLSRMSLELARHGEFNVFRRDAAELLSVKSGARSWEDAAREAKDAAKLSREARAKSGLPEESESEWPREWARALFYSELERRGADPENWQDQPAVAVIERAQPEQTVGANAKAKGNRPKSRR